MFRKRMDCFVIACVLRFSLFRKRVTEGGIDTLFVIVILCIVGFALAVIIKDKGTSFVSDLLDLLDTKTKALYGVS